MESFWDDQWNCHKCLTKYDYLKDDVREATLKKARTMKGCWGNRAKPMNFENVEFRSCIGNFVDQSTKTIVDMFLQHEKGTLIYAGGVATYPAKLVEVFNIMQGIKMQKLKEQRDENERKAKRARKASQSKPRQKTKHQIQLKRKR
jgi:hypothetical protein